MLVGAIYEDVQTKQRVKLLRIDQKVSIEYPRGRIAHVTYYYFKNYFRIVEQ